MDAKYDVLIVGAGLFGAVYAREATDKGKKCLVVEKRAHAGGNLYCQNVDGVNVHRYGAHIFHTGDERAWAYANRFARFNHFVNSPLAAYRGKLYNLPFNMNTFYQLWGVKTPEEAQKIIARQRSAITGTPRNLEEQAISLVGEDVYRALIKGYTEKQWGRDCADLPAFIIRRLPVRFTYDNNYFSDPHQGIPEGGYNPMIEKLLEGSEVKLNTDFLSDRSLQKIARRMVYTGPIDQYFGCAHDPLAYRSLRFEHERLEMDNYQGVAVVNHTEREVPYTRVIEHKHFEFSTKKHTVVTREYPEEWQSGMEMYYPVNDDVNQARLTKYQAMAAREESVHFGGRLGAYQYLDMDKTLLAALDLARQTL